MINKKTNLKYLSYIREEFNQRINFEQKYAAYTARAVRTLCSSGATKNSLYGLFAPHEDVQILFDRSELGEVTTDEKNIDFKYYFDSRDRLILIERFDPTSQYNNKLVNTIFVEYKKRRIKVLFCKGKTGNVQTIAECKLDLFDRVIRFLECTVGVDEYPYVYSVTRLKHALASIKIQRSVYSIWQAGDETLLSEKKYVYSFGKLREKTK